MERRTVIMLTEVEWEAGKGKGSRDSTFERTHELGRLKDASKVELVNWVKNELTTLGGITNPHMIPCYPKSFFPSITG